MVELNQQTMQDLIRHWRFKLKKAITEKSTQKGISSVDYQEAHTARCYIDAFQCVLVNHGLDKFPEEN